MKIQYLLAAGAQLAPVLAEVSTGRNGYGLIGYGIQMYQPYCAQACRDSFASAVLACTVLEDEHDHGDMPDMEMGGMQMAESTTTPECFTSDDIFLQTLAYCIASHCGDIDAWKIEKFWQGNVAGRQSVQPKPKISYGTALAQITTPPTEIYESGSLNKTSLVSEEVWQSNVNAEYNFESGEVVQEKYGIVILISGVAIPIGFSLLRFIPFPAVWRTKFYSWVIDPPAFGRKHSQPTFFGMELMPTRGQALFIFYFIVINVVFSAVSIRDIQLNAWYPGDTWGNIIGTVANRQGLLSFANLPLVFLYAGRNNILLWVTNWSHSTFLLLHRWIAAIATLQAVLHSVIWVRIKIHNHAHSTDSKEAYWIWGIVATLAVSIMVSTSFVPIRKRMYEVFLIGHIALAVLTVLGCYYHIIKRFQHQWGYETWIYVCMAVWGFDRVLRLLRIARNGVRRAIITVIDEDYVRVDVQGVSGNGHAYLYFPTLTWRVWENHPFSVASTVLPVTKHQHTPAPLDIEKSGVDATVRRTSDSLDGSSITSRHNVQVGLTFLIRANTGITALLKNRTSIPVLVEAPYCGPQDLSEYSNMVVIAGGVGITAILPLVRAHAGRSKLYWGARTQTIIEEMSGALAGVEKEVYVGKRMNIFQILENELKGETGHTVIVVSGPHSMCDDVRNEVSRLGRTEKISVKLVEESFSW